MNTRISDKVVRIEKPWGKMEQFTLNQPSTVQIHNFKKGEKPHKRQHTNWSSFWKLIDGEVSFQIDNLTKKLNREIDELMIGGAKSHHLHAHDNSRLLEIALGDKYNVDGISYFPSRDRVRWKKPDQLTVNQLSTVKILYVNPRSRLSYQRHKKRKEYWLCLGNNVEVLLNDKLLQLKDGESIILPRKSKHRLIGTDKPGRVLEISYGFFDEEDIERLEDDYRRQGTTNIEGTR